MYEKLGWEMPKFVHLPTVLNKSGQKLSKRHGDVAVGDFLKKGYLPEALINYLALVGWSPETNQEILSMKEMEEQFSFERVAKSGGVFDRDKLDWVNNQYIKSEPIERIAELSTPYLIEAGLITEDFAAKNKQWIEDLIETVRESMHTLAEAPEKVEFIFNDELKLGEEELETLKTDTINDLLDGFKSELAEVDEIDKEFANGLMKKVQKSTGVKGKNLFMPSRIALTGEKRGPEFANVIYLLGKDKILKRIAYIEENYLD